MSLAQASSIATLTADAGTIDGAGELTVTSSLAWSRATMSGSGTTVLAPGASGTLGSEPRLWRPFVNKGSMTISSGTFLGSSAAVFTNEGTFVNDSSYELKLSSSGSTPRFVNTGLLPKTAGTLSSVDWRFENRGEVQVQTGELHFGGGGDASDATGLWSGAGKSVFNGNGTFTMAGANVTGTLMVGAADVSVGDIQADGARVEVKPGTLTLTDAATVSNVDTLVIDGGGTLRGAGDVRVWSSFAWPRGTMSGSGRTVLAAGSQTSFGYGTLGRTLINRGTMTLITSVDSTGYHAGAPGAVLENEGTLIVNSENPSWLPYSLYTTAGSPAPVLRNRGTLKQTANWSPFMKTKVGWALDDRGIIDGDFEFLGENVTPGGTAAAEPGELVGSENLAENGINNCPIRWGG